MNKIKLTFVEMQKMINFVVDNIIEGGYGFKQPIIDYYTAVFYGGKRETSPIKFKSTDISEIYDNEYDTLKSISIDEIDEEQYNFILKAIDDELDRKTVIKAIGDEVDRSNKENTANNKELVAKLSETNEVLNKIADSIAKPTDAIANLADCITNQIVDLSFMWDMDNVKKLLESVSNIKENFNAKDFIHAMKEEGLFNKLEDNTTNGNTNNITVISNKEGD